MNWIERFIAAIATHKADVASHHAKTTAAGDITSGQFGLNRMPRAAVTLVLTAKGAGLSPAYEALPSVKYRNGIALDTKSTEMAHVGTGTMTTPADLNDDNITTWAGGDAVDEYTEIDFRRILKLTQYRQHGDVTNTGDGRFKIQYWSGSSWVDWITGIAVRTTYDWGSWTADSEIVTDKIRLVTTTVDSCGVSYIRELEVKY